MFIMNDEYKTLLKEFNDAMTKQLLEMRKQTIQMRNTILNINIEGNDIEAVGKCSSNRPYPNRSRHCGTDSRTTPTTAA